MTKKTFNKKGTILTIVLSLLLLLVGLVTWKQVSNNSPLNNKSEVPPAVSEIKSEEDKNIKIESRESVLNIVPESTVFNSHVYIKNPDDLEYWWSFYSKISPYDFGLDNSPTPSLDFGIESLTSSFYVIDEYKNASIDPFFSLLILEINKEKVNETKTYLASFTKDKAFIHEYEKDGRFFLIISDLGSFDYIRNRILSDDTSNSLRSFIEENSIELNNSTYSAEMLLNSELYFNTLFSYRENVKEHSLKAFAPLLDIGNESLNVFVFDDNTKKWISNTGSPIGVHQAEDIKKAIDDSYIIQEDPGYVFLGISDTLDSFSFSLTGGSVGEIFNQYTLKGIGQASGSTLEEEKIMFAPEAFKSHYQGVFNTSNLFYVDITKKADSTILDFIFYDNETHKREN